MKAPTTFLVDRAMAKQGPPVDGLKLWRDAAQEQVDAPVVDACLFSRPSNYAASLGATRMGGLLGRAALKQTQKVQAGGFPQHFLLAVTADEVIALERTVGGRGGVTGRPGPELARWPRATLGVGWEASGHLYNATITPPADDPAIRCCVGKSPLSESFLQLLADPARQTPAV
jgi:hypothetical protein